MSAQTRDTAGLGWIGIGKMGAPMATRLIQKHGSVSVFDTSKENCDKMVAAGAKVCQSVAEIGQTSRVIFTTIPHDTALLSVVFGTQDVPGLADTLAPGSTLVEMSTVSADASRQVAHVLSKKGVRYLRAPISGSTGMAEAGQLTVLASGDESAWETAEPLLEAFSVRQFFLGHSDEARFMKLVANTLVGATAALVGEALVLGRTGGLTDKQMLDVLTESAVASPLLKYKQDMIVHQDFSPAFSIEQMIKDFTLITEAARETGATMFATNLILQQYLAAAASGRKDLDFFALLPWVQSLSEDQVAKHSEQTEGMRKAG